MSNLNNSAPAISISGESLDVAGAINFKNVDKLRNQGKQLIAQQSSARIVINLQAIVSTDNSGLVLLIAWMRDARQLGKTVIYTHVPNFMESMSQVFGLHTILFKS
jgi:phospholipid transport system transporter-binding protein